MLFRILAADIQGIARADKSSLPQQTLMELMVQGISKEKLESTFTDASGNFHDYTTWECVSCDENDNVYQVCKMSVNYRGLNLEYVPSTVRRIIFMSAQLDGTVPWGALPPALEKLNLAVNFLEGSARLDLLADSTQRVNIARNSLTGSLLLEKLPKSPIELIAFKNNFSGSVNLSSVPPKCVEIDATWNNLTGGLDITALPDGFQKIGLGSNLLSGDINFRTMPDSMKDIDLEDTAFSGDIVFGEMPASFKRLMISSPHPIRIVNAAGEEFIDRRIDVIQTDSS